MPKRTNAFQTLVYQIQQHLKDNPDVTVTESKELPHRHSGTLREVDIVVEVQIGGATVVIGIECTAKSSKADATWVDAMKGKHGDLDTNLLILVSNSGFTKGAQKAADTDSFLEAITLEEANQRDWRSYAWAQHFTKAGCFEPKITSIHVHGDSDETIFDGCTLAELLSQVRVVRLSDGIELTLEELAVQLMAKVGIPDEQVDLWFRTEKTQSTGSFTYDIQLGFDKNDSVATFRGKKLDIQLIIFHVVCAATDVPLDLKLGNYKDTQVVYAEAESFLPEDDPELGNHVVFTITRDARSQIKSSVAFTNAKNPEQKIMPAKIVNASPASNPSGSLKTDDSSQD